MSHIILCGFVEWHRDTLLPGQKAIAVDLESRFPLGSRAFFYCLRGF